MVILNILSASTLKDPIAAASFGVCCPKVPLAMMCELTLVFTLYIYIYQSKKQITTTAVRLCEKSTSTKFWTFNSTDEWPFFVRMGGREGGGGAKKGCGRGYGGGGGGGDSQSSERFYSIHFRPSGENHCPWQDSNCHLLAMTPSSTDQKASVRKQKQKRPVSFERMHKPQARQICCTISWNARGSK